VRLILFIPLFLSHCCSAQGDTAKAKAFTFSGYLELYYGFDRSNPANHLRPSFVYSHKRHNEVAVNMAMAKASWQQSRYRANVALMAGNYAQYNLAAEPTFAQFIYEANAGIKLSAKRDIWLDAGIMPSHIGFESALGGDCWTLTRSMAADNSPYYEAGVKLSSNSANGKWGTALLLLNGWQRIARPDGINRPSLGMQCSYRPNGRLLLNYSNFVGSDRPDSTHAWRIFHNFYAQYNGNRWGITAGLDMGTDRAANGRYALWYTPQLVVRFAPNTTNAFAARAELYSDPKQIIVSTGTPNGFHNWGASFNYDRTLGQYLRWRIEGKWYQASNDVFNRRGNPVRSNQVITTALIARL
jgi:hypothetical protein